MSSTRPHLVRGLVLGALALLIGLGVLARLTGFTFLPNSPHPAPPDPKPHLAVLIVFDQLRGDYLERWAPLFDNEGFQRLCKEGAWFQNCHYPYSYTLTGPGHASLATGCSPDRHGIVANEWLIRGREQYCVASDRHEFVPPVIRKPDDKIKAASPELLLSPTLADVLKEATRDAGKVVALSLKDRSAVLPGGRKPNACYWVDKKGKFITSTYYRDTLHPWVKEFNDSPFVDQWLGKDWQRLRPELDYVKWSGKDDVRGEGTREFSRTFPHRLDDGPKKQKYGYYNALAISPFGNDVLLELTRRAIDAEKLGQGETADLLCVSFSSNDLIGHVWGPDSQEVLDVTLRSDLIVRDLLKMLDDKVGKGRYTLALSADHGICPLPEVARARGKNANRVDPKPLRSQAEEHLAKQFSPGPWIQAISGANIYLNLQQIDKRGLKRAEVQEALANWLPSQPGILLAYSASQLEKGVASADEIGAKVMKSFRRDRSGDVFVVGKPFYLFSDPLEGVGTTHGSPHEYDTHVPLVIYGPEIIPGIHKEKVTPQAAAVILARALGIPKPRDAEPEVPTGLFRGE